jgi:peptidoglycan/LPS O-acetylase OafA/YrhL
MIGSCGTISAPDGVLEDVKPSGSLEAYYPWFDWLRFGLALVVLFYLEGLFKSFHAGNLAVQVFFALSGWLIGGILVKLQRKELPRFYVNRALRIWPYAAATIRLCGGLVRWRHA